MSTFNLSGARPINYNIFANYCQEIFDSHKTLDRISRRSGASHFDIKWMYWQEHLFLKHTKKLLETCRHTKYQDMPSLDYKLVISELQQCLEDMKQVYPKLGLQDVMDVIFIDSVCIKIARTLQLIPSLSSCISDNETHFFDMLPDNVIVSIFNHLPIKTRTTIELVNKRWYQLSKDSWGFLTHLNTEDYYAIQDMVNFDRNEGDNRDEILKRRREVERRLLELVKRMCHWKTNKVHVKFDVWQIFEGRPLTKETAIKIDLLCPYLKSIRLQGVYAEFLNKKFCSVEKLFIKAQGDFRFYQQFGPLSKIKVLILHGTPSMSFCADSCVFPVLEMIDLSGTDIKDDDCLALLRNCPKLDTIELRSTAVTAKFVFDFFHSPISSNGSRTIKAELKIACEPSVWRDVLDVGTVYRYYHKKCFCGEDGSAYFIGYKSWVFAIEADSWCEFWREDFLTDWPEHPILPNHFRCWFSWFPDGLPYYDMDEDFDNL